MKLKNYTHFFFFLGILSIISLNSCMKEVPVTENDPSLIRSMDDLVVNPAFRFNTDGNVIFDIYTKDNQDNPLPGIVVSVYTDYPDSNGVIIANAITDDQGYLQTTLVIPNYLDTVVLGTSYVGLPLFLKVPIENNTVSCTFGGKFNERPAAGPFITPIRPKSSLWTLQFMGTYDSQGVPSYLQLPNDPITASLLQDVNATLPEYQPVPTYHPNYLAVGNQTDLVITQLSDVWITFVHEGAGYRNTLGYYTYALNNPPTSIANINVVKVIFPNVSYFGSGGGLASGNKVKLGTFPANTGIGWVLIADGFKGNTISGLNTFYSNPNFNPESNPALRQHNVIISDPGRNLVLIGFEDLKRDSGSDNDFNDAVFYAKSNPVTAIQSGNFPSITYTSPDTDGDGVANTFDEYPLDASKAFNSYYPSKGNYASLSFEDLWPYRGDYDMNDLVVDYNIQQITNAANKVVDIKATYIVRAIGAGYENGFGFQLGIPNSRIGTVSGVHIDENYVALNSQNLEQGQTKATVIVFDNAYKILHFAGGFGVNTTPGSPFVTPDTLRLDIPFTTPTLQSEIGVPPYNPFIMINKERGREVHLPDMPPTALADFTLFGTGNDDSKPAKNRFYRTKNNLPWVLNVTDKFDYPIEKAPLITGYTKFVEWSQSTGVTYNDWFKNLPNYRIQANIYSH